MLNQPPRPNSNSSRLPSPPDGYASKPPEVTLAERQQASAWATILNLPDNAAMLAAQRVEGLAREAVMALDPATAPEGQMRCTLAAWRHARNLFASMSIFVQATDRKITAEAEALKAK